MQKQEQISIVYNKFCPFAQRALLTAIEKDLPATFTKVSLGEKGSFFANTYHKALGHDPKSDGKVPILIHGDRILTESEPVCWYLAESFSSGSSLIPNDPFERARMRLMMGQQSAAVIELFNKAKYKQFSSLEDYRQEIRQVLTEMDAAIRGDYLMGEAVTLADLMIYPWFERWIIL
jgi:glutathione S-transferase